MHGRHGQIKTIGRASGGRGVMDKNDVAAALRSWITPPNRMEFRDEEIIIKRAVAVIEQLTLENAELRQKLRDRPCIDMTQVVRDYFDQAEK
jgi:hypothetical protein